MAGGQVPAVRAVHGSRRLDLAAVVDPTSGDGGAWMGSMGPWMGSVGSAMDFFLFLCGLSYEIIIEKRKRQERWQ